MEVRKQKKRNIRLTLLLLLLTAILLIMSSYAWFTANQTVKIDTLKVNVAAQNGLQISADAITWSAMIDTEDLITAANATSNGGRLTNQIPMSMVPVSTIGDIDATTGFMDMYLGTVQANADTGKDELTAEKTVEATGTEGDFIAFDMFLKVEAPVDLALTANSTVKAEGKEGIERAARVAFVVVGNKPTGTAYTEIQALKAADASNRYIWEPNYDLHSDAAIAHAQGSYGKTITGTTERLVYDGVKAPIDAGIEIPNTNATDNTDYFAQVPIEYETKSTFGNNEADQLQIFGLQAGITKIRVYMWIEGQDYDCENTASGSDVAYNLQLTKIDRVVVP